MGTGNALITSWTEQDKSLYNPETFYVDLSPSESDINDEVENNRIENNEEDLDETKEKLNEWNVEQFKEDFGEIINELNLVSTFNEKDDNTTRELTASFIGEATILESTKNLLVVSVGGESFHFSFGFVPNFKYSDIYDELYQEDLTHLQIINITEIEYKKRLKDFYSDYYEIMSKVLEYNETKISMRCGAWTSGPFDINQLNEIFKTINQ